MRKVGVLKNIMAGTVVFVCTSLAIVSQAQTLTTLVSFNGTNGLGSTSSLVQGTDGNFYGVTPQGGGTGGYGNVFKMTPDGTITSLYGFCSVTPSICADGVAPMGPLVQGIDGNFYGTTSQGGAPSNEGTVFKITPGGVLSTIYRFCIQGQDPCPDGSNPNGGLVQGSDGAFYGTTENGGPNRGGTFFKITTAGVLTTLHGLCPQPFSCPDGQQPLSGLVQGLDRNFYGTAQDGSSGGGTIFKITPDGTLTTLYKFNHTCTNQPACPDGSDVNGGLVRGSDGNFYGTTLNGGVAVNGGTVFQITPGGALTTLYSFCAKQQPYCADGSAPNGGMVQGSDGSFYGTTQQGGANFYSYSGTVFKITPGGTLNTLYSFCSLAQNGCTDGNYPAAGMIRGNDENIYGTTSEGGINDYGTIFRLQLPKSAGSDPSVPPGSVVSASAFGAFPSVAPGSWIEIYGSNLASGSRSWSGSDFTGINAPTSLDGTSVTIGGQSAFIDYISHGQVNAQVPSNVSPGAQPLIVKTASGESSPSTVTVNATQPGLLAPASFKIGGKQYVAALFSDGTTYVLPPGAIAGLTSRRAQPGDRITFYGIGFGPVIPNIPAGEIVQQTNALASSFKLKFAQTQATVAYAGLAPSEVGLYQFNVTVPNVASSDAVPVTFTLGGLAGTQTLYIAVQSGNSGTQVKSLTFSPASVAGGGTVQGTVVLSEPAPAGGAIVALSSSLSAATVPSTVTVPANATSATFTVSTSAANSNQSATITATYGGTSAQASLTVTPVSGALPQFNEITAANPTITANGQTNISGSVVVESFSGSGYSIAEFSADFPLASSFPVAHFSASFSNISVNAQTFTLSGLAIGPNSFMQDKNFTAYGITDASVTLTFSPGAVPAVGTLTGTFTLTSSLATLTGTISGPYTAF